MSRRGELTKPVAVAIVVEPDEDPAESNTVEIVVETGMSDAHASTVEIVVETDEADDAPPIDPRGATLADRQVMAFLEQLTASDMTQLYHAEDGEASPPEQASARASTTPVDLSAPMMPHVPDSSPRRTNAYPKVAVKAENGGSIEQAEQQTSSMMYRPAIRPRFAKRDLLRITSKSATETPPHSSSVRCVKLLDGTTFSLADCAITADTTTLEIIDLATRMLGIPSHYLYCLGLWLALEGECLDAMPLAPDSCIGDTALPWLSGSSAPAASDMEDTHDRRSPSCCLVLGIRIFSRFVRTSTNTKIINLLHAQCSSSAEARGWTIPKKNDEERRR